MAFCLTKRLCWSSGKLHYKHMLVYTCWQIDEWLVAISSCNILTRNQHIPTARIRTALPVLEMICNTQNADAAWLAEQEHTAVHRQLRTKSSVTVCWIDLFVPLSKLRLPPLTKKWPCTPASCRLLEGNCSMQLNGVTTLVASYALAHESNATIVIVIIS